MKKKISRSSTFSIPLLFIVIVILNLVACDSDDIKDFADDFVTATLLKISVEATPEKAAPNETITIKVSLSSSTGLGIDNYPINLKLIFKNERDITNRSSEKILDVINLGEVDVYEVFCEEITGSGGDAECDVTSSISNSIYTIEAFSEDKLVSDTVTIRFNY